MNSVACRIVGVAFLLYVLDGAYPLPAGAASDAQIEEQLRQMPRAVEEPTEVLPEPRPMPHELLPDIIVSPEPDGFHPPTRVNRYAIWQLYDVNRLGQFRPRVVYSPYGFYYLYDGRPFPWVSERQLEIAPKVISP